ncbi:MAG: hypothetical protein KDD04_11590 [Sinomicrobium sp.]|nr:hypothetical protein [Sinomicrobium sp.]
MKNRSKFLALAVGIAMLPGCEKDNPACSTVITTGAAAPQVIDGAFGVMLKQDTLLIYLNKTPRCIRFINNTPKDSITP